MGKPTICKGENKGADQLRSNCETDQRLCFHYTDSTIPLLSKSKISSLKPSSVTVQPGLCWTWLEPKLLIFSCTGSYTGNSKHKFRNKRAVNYLCSSLRQEQFHHCLPGPVCSLYLKHRKLRPCMNCRHGFPKDHDMSGKPKYH